jgi:hypothetical protein
MLAGPDDVFTSCFEIPACMGGCELFSARDEHIVGVFVDACCVEHDGGGSVFIFCYDAPGVSAWCIVVVEVGIVIWFSSFLGLGGC